MARKPKRNHKAYKFWATLFHPDKNIYPRLDGYVSVTFIQKGCFTAWAGC